MSVSRRAFLKTGGAVALGLGLLPDLLARAAAAGRASGKKLIILFQRGAADGLNIVIPHAEKSYYRLRPNISVPRPRPGDPRTAVDLDGFFALHPEMAPLKRYYDAGSLAIVHAAGSPDTSRSHFDAQDFMESGTPGQKSTRDGWMNRALQAQPGSASTSFRAVSVTQSVPRVLTGTVPALAIPSLDRFGLPDGRYMDLARRGMEALYRASGDTQLAFTARETFEAVDVVQGIAGAGRRSSGARYPGGAIGETLRQIAQLIRADVGLEVAFADVGGWDHHINEGGSDGALANLLRQYAGALDAFAKDVESYMDELVLVTLSEFGRTVAENGNRGTDHGHANAYFVLGGPVAGGAVRGDWPGLERSQLFEERDLAVTTDFRDVLAEILAGHLGVVDFETVFPDYEVERSRFRGLLKSA